MRAFLAFTSFKSHAWRGSPRLDLPLDTGEVLTARQSYCSVFTCPTQRVLISCWMPARCSRPDNLTFFCLYLSNTASLDLPLDAGEVLPARQSYFPCLYLSNTASPDISLDAGEVLPARQSYFSCLYLPNTTSLNLPLDAGEVLPARQSYFFCLYLSNTASLNLPLDAGEVLLARQTLFRLLAPKISNPFKCDIPGRFGNLSFQSTTGEVRPPSSRVSISRQMPQESPGWTTSPFPPSSAKLTHQTGGQPTSWMSAKHPDQT